MLLAIPPFFMGHVFLHCSLVVNLATLGTLTVLLDVNQLFRVS
ncbi:hypothetical protein ES319_D13G088000v1 [Gossypium barbadense]|uniref:Uncharacterized protein n=1 Tax=Gossypium barbadense TaxID=3634 RepID=A0A5J5NIW4_GOSBA|nr:hypothetical protein ES319_D13G088000v1 [Gossypium barbadense]